MRLVGMLLQGSMLCGKKHRVFGGHGGPLKKSHCLSGVKDATPCLAIIFSGMVVLGQAQSQVMWKWKKAMTTQQAMPSAGLVLLMQGKQAGNEPAQGTSEEALLMGDSFVIRA